MAIVCFPDIFPDETWQSVCARFAQRMRYPTFQAILRELQDSDDQFPHPDFPTQVDHVTNEIPVGLESLEIIKKHTLYPLHAPFLTTEQRAKLVSEMCGVGNPLRLLGFVQVAKQQPQSLRFCPTCIENDSRRYGEPYWHRAHQVGFVRYCPEHNVALVESPVRFRPYVLQEGLPLCQKWFLKNESQGIPEAFSGIPVLQSLTRDAFWLLNHGGYLIETFNLHARFSELLQRQGIATSSGRIKTQMLYKQFSDCFSKFPLELLGCSVSEPRANWVLDLLRRGSPSPVQNLLVMQVLNVSAEEFFSQESTQPFGVGPWKCLNPTVTHFNEKTIHTVKVKHTRDGRPIGLFSCACGYTYKQVPRRDQSQPDWVLVIKYGVLWGEAFSSAWLDTSITMISLMQRFGLDHGTLRHQAIRLKLPHVRHNARTQNPQVRLGRGAAKQYRPKRQINLAEYRAAYLAAKNNDPEATRTTLKTRQKKEVSALRRYDQEWLEQNQPTLRLNEVSRKSRINWAERDQVLEQRVIVAKEQILQIKPPIRASTSAILRAMKAPSVASRPHAFLPKTWAALKLQAETAKAFCKRKSRK